MEILISVLSTCGIGSILLFFIKRFFDKRDTKEKERHEAAQRRDAENQERLDSIITEVGTSLETIRLLSYSRMSEETERLLNKGYATPAERRFIGELYSNYKEHGWNGDMDARLARVYALPTIDIEKVKNEE